MRTFNGLQIFTQQLTNSGQLDARYVRNTGDQDVHDLKTFKDGIVLQGSTIPTSEFYPGISGQIALDSNTLYICVSGNGNSNGRWKFLSLINFEGIDI
jgi:hypothetical protein